ncbi:MAG TPA: SCP2 sterol-binding domain-containing protein [Devosia sp.]|nr:SCP2 sterol-binding domain-containing protein [Devosia sp.]
MTRALRLVRLAALLPLPLIEHLAQHTLNQVLIKHPNLFDRLDGHLAKRFGFVATDLGIAFVVVPATRTIRAVALNRFRRTGPWAPHALVSGPLPVLLSLLEGSLDGDAEFFSRALTVEGDMEAVLALRNALDDAGIDLPSDLGAAAGPLAPLATQIARRARSVMVSGAAWN